MRVAVSGMRCAALLASGIEPDVITLEMFNNLTPDQEGYANRLFRECDNRASGLVADHCPPSSRSQKRC